MTKERKNETLVFLELEIQRAKENAEKTDEASKFIMTGPSQSGDKYHAQNAAALAKSYVKRLEKLKKEIQEAKEEPETIVKPTCYIEVEYDDGSKLNFYLVENAVSLAGFLFISSLSPLGSSILEKKVGETFTYEFQKDGAKRKFSGKIVRIE